MSSLHSLRSKLLISSERKLSGDPAREKRNNDNGNLGVIEAESTREKRHSGNVNPWAIEAEPTREKQHSGNPGAGEDTATADITGHSAWMNRISEHGNTAVDWLEYIQYVQKNVSFENTEVKEAYLTLICKRATQAVCGQENLTEAHARLLILEAELKAKVSPDDSRILFNQARSHAKKFAIVHIAAAQFEVDSGNLSKARRILEKGVEFAAKPVSYLTAAFRNLRDGRSILLSEADHMYTDLPSSTSGQQTSQSHISASIQLISQSHISISGQHTSQSNISTSGQLISQSHSSTSAPPMTDSSALHLRRARISPKDTASQKLTAPTLSSYKPNPACQSLLASLSTSQSQATGGDMGCSHKPSHQSNYGAETNNVDIISSKQCDVNNVSPANSRLPDAADDKISLAQSGGPVTQAHVGVAQTQVGVAQVSVAQADDGERQLNIHHQDNGKHTTRDANMSSHSESHDVLSSSWSARHRPLPLWLGKPQRVIRASVPQPPEDGIRSDNQVKVTDSHQKEAERFHGNDSLEMSNQAEHSPTASDSGVLTQSSMGFSPCLKAPSCDDPPPLTPMDSSAPPSSGDPRHRLASTAAPPLTPMDYSQVLTGVADEPMEVDKIAFLEPNVSAPKMTPHCDAPLHQSELSCSQPQFSYGKQDTNASRTHSTLLQSMQPASRPLNQQASNISNPLTREQSASTQHKSMPMGLPVSSQQRSEVVGGVQHNPEPPPPTQQPQYVQPPQYTQPLQLTQPPLVKSSEVLEVNGESYWILKVIGKGGFSQVYEVCDKDKNLRAIKHVNLNEANEAMLEGLRNEITLLQRLQYSDKVIKMYNYEHHRERNALLVVMERGDTDLASLFRSHSKGSGGAISANTRRFYWEEMLKAVQVLHKEGIVHSDLKPANFLLVQGRLKLIDFGIANAIAQDHTSVVRDQLVGTVTYMSPEAIQDTCQGSEVDEHGQAKPHIKLGVKSDVWSLGCILYNMVYGKTPFQAIPSVLGRFQAIMNPAHLIKFPDIRDTQLVDVMQKCLIRDARQRISIEELLAHPYLRNPQGQPAECIKPRAAAPGMQHLVDQLSEANISSPRSMSVLLEGLLDQVKSGKEINVKSALSKRPGLQATGAKPAVPAELRAFTFDHVAPPCGGNGKQTSRVNPQSAAKQGQRAPLKVLNIHDMQ